MTTWEPLFVLPDIEINDPIESDVLILVSRNDERVWEIEKKYARFGEFISKFTDQFGVKLNPSVLLLKEDAPKNFRNVEAISSFRDSIALSCIPIQRARNLIYPRDFHPTYTDWFEFYPWVIDRNYQRLTCLTPAIGGVHSVDKFSGQSSPALFRLTLESRDFDEPLLKTLLRRWLKRYGTEHPVWHDVALFRSLNMAMSACRVPGARDTTIFSIGRGLSLFVSAFEILVHSGNAKVGYKDIYEILSGDIYIYEELREQSYEAYAGLNKTVTRNLACWIYGELYRIRNDFLHGNPVAENVLNVKESGRSFYQYSAILYRLALTSFLPLKASNEGGIGFDKDGYLLLENQSDVEKSLQTILSPEVPEED